MALPLPVHESFVPEKAVWVYGRVGLDCIIACRAWPMCTDPTAEHLSGLRYRRSCGVIAEEIVMQVGCSVFPELSLCPL